MIDATVRFVGANGRSVTLQNTASQLMREPGGSGWGMVNVVNSWFEGAADGARLRGTRRVQRDLTVPVSAFGANRDDVETQLRQLTNVIHEPFQVFMEYNDGRAYWITAVYDSGASGAYTPDPEHWAQMPLVFKCPDPYWTSVAFQSFSVKPASGAPFLPELANLHVTSSVAQGQITINNVGDIASRPTWTIKGPGGNLSIAYNGVGLVLNKALTAADVVTIKWEDYGWKIEDGAGVNLYPLLGPAPFFPEFPPGTSVIDVTMTDADANTTIQVIYPERREVMY